MKTLLIAVAVLMLALVLVVLIGKDIIARAVIKNGIEARTGMRLIIENVDVGVLSASAKIDNLVLLNPQGYEDTVMAEIPELFLDCDLGDLLLGKLHFQKVRLNLRRLFIVKNREGGLNVHALKGVARSKGVVSKPEAERRQAVPKNEATTKRPPALKSADAFGSGRPAEVGRTKAGLDEGGRGSFKIDRLELKLGKVIYRDYTPGAPIGMIELNLNIDESYEDITSPGDVVKTVLARALVDTVIAKVVNIDFGSIRSGMAETVERGMEEIKGAAERAAEMLKEKLKPPFGD